MKSVSISAALSIALIACTGGENAQATQGESEAQTFADISPVDREPFATKEIGKFNEPWAMTFLPNGFALVTEKSGNLIYLELNEESEIEERANVRGVPDVDYGGQGGLGDVILAPDYSETGNIYLSWVEAGEKNTRGAVVARAKLTWDKGVPHEPYLTQLQIIWKQNPKVTGKGHYSHRMVFSPDGKYLFIGSGERQKFDPAQDMTGNLGKIVRLNPDGTIPKDNPFTDDEGALPEIWSLGHRNILGMAFDSSGKLWNQEMGPQDGDELNLVQRGSNYGYPIVSEGNHYDDRKIPNHDTRPEFAAPKVAWVPTIAPSGLIFYSGTMFPAWKGNAFIGGLASESLIRVSFSEEGAKEAERFKMGARIREIEQGPDGALWVLQDGKDGKLLKLTPPK